MRRWKGVQIMKKIGRPRLPKDDPTTLEIVRLYSEGMSAEKIAKIVYLSNCTVFLRLKSAGVHIRSNQTRHLSQRKIDQIRALHNEGVLEYKIADIVRVSVPTVRKYIKNREINYV